MGFLMSSVPDSNVRYHCMVIGNPIAHSKSPDLHQAFAQQTGITLSLPTPILSQRCRQFLPLSSKHFCRWWHRANVTVPFKEMAFALCQQRVNYLNTRAWRVQSIPLPSKPANLYGDNTDGRGLVADLLSQGVRLKTQTLLFWGQVGRLVARFAVARCASKIAAYCQSHSRKSKI